MAGYNGFSKSNNAVNAESDGCFPLTRAAKAAGISAELVKQFVSRCEWHHTSKMFNRVDYFDVAEIRIIFGLDPETDEASPNPDAVAALATWKPAKLAADRLEGCAVEWIEWSGSFKHPKATERSAESVAVTVKGSMATVHLPSGDLRKKLGANGFSIKTADGRRI